MTHNGDLLECGLLAASTRNVLCCCGLIGVLCFLEACRSYFHIIFPSAIIVVILIMIGFGQCCHRGYFHVRWLSLTWIFERRCVRGTLKVSDVR